LAVQLLRRFLPGSRVYLIEKNAKFGGGLAYSTGNPNHLLNVRAGRMSAFADAPDHFVDWLRKRARTGGDAEIHGRGSDQFVPRHLYGAYIQDLLGNEIWQTGNGRNLYLVPDEAVALWQRPDDLSVQVRGGRTYEVDVAVLATGNFPHDDTAAHHYANPWSPQALAGLDPEAPVLLIGTGLTMIDTVISLLDQGHAGPIHAISRRGLLPRRHGEAPPQPSLPLAQIDCSSIVAMLHAVRHAVRRAGGDVNAWRSIVDALRPYTQQIWQSLSTAEKRRFLRHLRPWWEVHRHRMAPVVADVIEGALRRGQLRLQAARLQALAPDRQGRRCESKKAGIRRAGKPACCPCDRLLGSAMRLCAYRQRAGPRPALAGHGPPRSAQSRPRRHYRLGRDQPLGRALAPDLRPRSGHPRAVLGNHIGARHPRAVLERRRTHRGALGSRRYRRARSRDGLVSTPQSILKKDYG
jgi:uncharacterized NAD(P)/FAD-binding protein YdhS